MMTSPLTVEAPNTLVVRVHHSPLSLNNFLKKLKDKEEPHIASEDDVSRSGSIPTKNESKVDGSQDTKENSSDITPTTDKRRIPILDTVRAVLLLLLVIHASIIEIIASNAERYSNIRGSHPRLVAFASFFTAFHKACFIPLLFFISGISSRIVMLRYGNARAKFILKKSLVAGVCSGVSVLVLLAAQLVRWAFFRSPKRILQTLVAVDESYYATEKGKMEMMYGPLRYITVLAIFDCAYAVSIPRDSDKLGQLIQATQRRLERKLKFKLDNKKWLASVTLVLLFIQLSQFVFIPSSLNCVLPTVPGSNSPKLLFLVRSVSVQLTNDSFPFLCILAYIMGINITTVGSFYHNSKSELPSTRRFVIKLVWRVGLLAGALYMLYFYVFSYNFAHVFLDPLGRVNFDRDIYTPHNINITGDSSTDIQAAAASYALWSIAALFILFDTIAPVILYSESPSPSPSSRTSRMYFDTLMNMHHRPKWFAIMYFPSLYVTHAFLDLFTRISHHHHLVTSIVLCVITSVWLTESLVRMGSLLVHRCGLFIG